MKCHLCSVVVIVTCLVIGACADDGPTNVPGEIEPLVLVVEPSASIAMSDSHGMAVIFISASDIGGLLTVEIRADHSDWPLVSEFSVRSTAVDCADAGGALVTVTGLPGQKWRSRAGNGAASMQLSQAPEDSPLLFRASFIGIPSNPDSNVGECGWLITNGLDVGFQCTSSREPRLLSKTLPGSGDSALQ